ncbi:hypothetical protein [Massilia timonae]|jgi:hypothetical protein|uniref:hypothetical protein n=1 Tax=Massilia timonae TaxID=47229 RepID=UPI002899499D|nr:hypothetical protein [Massilia timonae]
MITTHEAHEAPMFSIGPGFSTWRTATLTFGMPYVFVNYGLKEGRLWVYQTSILWDSNDVLDFCRRLKANKFAKIVDISVLEPFRREKKQTWRWTKVLEVRSYEEDSVEHPVYINEAGEAVGLTPEEAKRKMKLICKTPRNSA